MPSGKAQSGDETIGFPYLQLAFNKSKAQSAQCGHPSHPTTRLRRLPLTRRVPSALRSAVAAIRTLGWPPRQLLGCIAHGVRGVLDCLAHHSTAADFSSCAPLLLQLPPPLLLDILRWAAARTAQRGSPAQALHTAPGAYARRLTPSTRSTTLLVKDRPCLYCLLLCPRPSAPVQCAAASRALLVVAYAA